MNSTLVLTKLVHLNMVAMAAAIGTPTTSGIQATVETNGSQAAAVGTVNPLATNGMRASMGNSSEKLKLFDHSSQMWCLLASKPMIFHNRLFLRSNYHQKHLNFTII